MAYECMGPKCPNFQNAIAKIVSETTNDDGTPFFDMMKDAERLAPVAQGVCTSHGNSMGDIVTITETDCGSDISRRFDADPMAFIVEYLNNAT